MAEKANIKLYEEKFLGLNLNWGTICTLFGMIKELVTICNRLKLSAQNLNRGTICPLVKNMGQIYAITLLFFAGSLSLFGQTISGTVFDKNSNQPIGYVNVGIVGKVGAVSEQNGRYALVIEPEHYNDTLMFSYIGYHPYFVKVSDFLTLNNGNVSLEEKAFEINELIVRPRRTRQSRLGISARHKVLCFDTTSTGFEDGLLIKNENTVIINEINYRVTSTYDTVVFRVNIYKAGEDMRFENIMNSPAYVTLPKKQNNNQMTVDLRHLNIVVQGDFLVAFEYVKLIGTPFDEQLSGPQSPHSIFCYLGDRSSIYKTFQRANRERPWRSSSSSISTGISISVLVDVFR